MLALPACREEITAPDSPETLSPAAAVLQTPTFLAAGWYHTFGLATDGHAWCWGSNANGQLGNGHPGVNSAIPSAVGGS